MEFLLTGTAMIGFSRKTPKYFCNRVPKHGLGVRPVSLRATNVLRVEAVRHKGVGSPTDLQTLLFGGQGCLS
jgi:hypothetical protein